MSRGDGVQLNLLKSYGMDYRQAYQLQRELLTLRQKGEIEDTLFLTSHPHVITIGRAGSRDNLLVSEAFLQTRRIQVVPIERGGDITYHGPGQIVGYPIINLGCFEKDLHLYVYRLEQMIIDLLQDYEINAGRIEGLTGVWVGNEKIAAIGIAVSKWVTWHGFALNVAPSLSYFNYIIPCGISDKGVTSLQKILGREISNEEVEGKLIEKFKHQFGYSRVEEIKAGMLGKGGKSA
ncbi:lipoyl(octanoyl) transferase LipB [Sporomusa carbonis]|uniref:lipoyl(octanoyl) transferase LipB n=1 Tax=Sporomusa carbonis TaxID=3076075 RepID=UPI003C79A662